MIKHLLETYFFEVDGAREEVNFEVVTKSYV